MHSMTMSMVREKAVVTFTERIRREYLVYKKRKISSYKCGSWLELKKGFNVYLYGNGVMVIFRDGVLLELGNRDNLRNVSALKQEGAAGVGKSSTADVTAINALSLEPQPVSSITWEKCVASLATDTGVETGEVSYRARLGQWQVSVSCRDIANAPTPHTVIQFEPTTSSSSVSSCAGGGGGAWQWCEQQEEHMSATHLLDIYREATVSNFLSCSSFSYDLLCSDKCLSADKEVSRETLNQLQFYHMLSVKEMSACRDAYQSSKAQLRRRCAWYSLLSSLELRLRCSIPLVVPCMAMEDISMATSASVCVLHVTMSYVASPSS